MASEFEKLSRMIQSKGVDKVGALALFESLSDEEKDQILVQLNAALASAEISPEKRLKALDQRELSEDHRQYIAALSKRYAERVPKSRDNIAKNQRHFVDQRRPFHLLKELKPLHFQITYKYADGAYVHDVDDNRYIDISGDMGVNIFGHKPAFVMDAVKGALDQGIPLAGYSERIFETTRLFSEITGHDRVLFTQSGTESVMFAVRIARAATGKKKIVLFDGSYHGLSDAVVAVADAHGNSQSMGPGMLQEFASEIIVLNYGDERSLDLIEQRAHEIACVLVEPVQSRHPYRKPIAFLQELRKLTIEQSIPLIFDEMITGFRICPRGAQGLFNIKPDMATYGKIPGGGMPTGVIAGSAKFMDYVDGGEWSLDDDTMPKAKRTGMAGTHTQNPIKIAAAHAILSEIKARCSDATSCENCNCFQKTLNDKTTAFAEELNQYFETLRIPVFIDHFGSLFRFRFIDSLWGVTEALFFLLLRMSGVETNIQGNCFFTTAHTDDDIAAVRDCVKNCIGELLRQGFFKEPEEQPASTLAETTVATDIDASAIEQESYDEQQGPLEALASLLRKEIDTFLTMER